ncbi:hypothetical protein QQ056_17825 [Oscillatoria laete-virens NRMC-F 0139]|nr:hypothetical protein [Oscillatoria laete-virens]MDL5055392.1 hypothetical protein [Oscillatoria laete-virens NRMC-F 0139]
MKKFFEILLAFVFLIVLVGGTYKILELIFVSLPSWAFALTTTGLVGVITLALSNYFTTKREIELKLREDKTKVYSSFIKGWFNVLLNKDNVNYLDIQDFKQFIADFTGDLILWGSDEVIKEYSNFRELAINLEPNPNIQILQFEKLMYSMRKDLGHKNKDLYNHELLKLFINDFDPNSFKQLSESLPKNNSLTSNSYQEN